MYYEQNDAIKFYKKIKNKGLALLNIRHENIFVRNFCNSILSGEQIKLKCGKFKSGQRVFIFGANYLIEYFLNDCVCLVAEYVGYGSTSLVSMKIPLEELEHQIAKEKLKIDKHIITN